MRKIIASLFAVSAVTASAQSALDLVDEDVREAVAANIERLNNLEPSNMLTAMSPAPYAHLRFLDRLNGRVRDFEMAVGESRQEKLLSITVKSCYAPNDDSASDAAAFLVVQDERDTVPAFQGWMLASSPALSALEHPRYDVWVVACSQSQRNVENNATAAAIGEAGILVPPDRDEGAIAQ